jgi:hypothetical protein
MMPRKLKEGETYKLSEEQRAYKRSMYQKHKVTQLEQQRKYRARNPEKWREYGKKWAKDNKERTHAMNRANQMKRDYGLSPEGYYLLFVYQLGSCAICCKEVDFLGQHTHIDHDHKTGKVRGILCNLCNHLIGESLESPVILRRAIDYLEEQKC